MSTCFTRWRCRWPSGQCSGPRHKCPRTSTVSFPAPQLKKTTRPVTPFVPPRCWAHTCRTPPQTPSTPMSCHAPRSNRARPVNTSHVMRTAPRCMTRIHPPTPGASTSLATARSCAGDLTAARQCRVHRVIDAGHERPIDGEWSRRSRMSTPAHRQPDRSHTGSPRRIEQSVTQPKPPQPFARRLETVAKVHATTQGDRHRRGVATHRDRRTHDGNVSDAAVAATRRRGDRRDQTPDERVPPATPLGRRHQAVAFNARESTSVRTCNSRFFNSRPSATALANASVHSSTPTSVKILL